MQQLLQAVMGCSVLSDACKAILSAVPSLPIPVLCTRREWGQAFLTPVWAAAATQGTFHIVYVGVGSEQDNQDIYVLRRVGASA